MSSVVPRDQPGGLDDALIGAIEKLAAEFSYLPRFTIYETVAAAMPDTQMYLPDANTFGKELVRETRIRLHYTASASAEIAGDNGRRPAGEMTTGRRRVGVPRG